MLQMNAELKLSKSPCESNMKKTHTQNKKRGHSVPNTPPAPPPPRHKIKSTWFRRNTKTCKPQKLRGKISNYKSLIKKKKSDMKLKIRSF